MIKPFEGLRMFSGAYLALLFVGIVTLIMTSVVMSYHIFIEDEEQEARDKLINTTATNAENIRETINRIDVTIGQNDRNLGYINETIGQNDRNLKYINESIAGSTATVGNQEVIKQYLKAVIIQNNESLANQIILENLTNFLRTNFNESYVSSEAQQKQTINHIEDQLTQLLERNNNNTNSRQSY